MTILEIVDKSRQNQKRRRELVRAPCCKMPDAMHFEIPPTLAALTNERSFIML